MSRIYDQLQQLDTRTEREKFKRGVGRSNVSHEELLRLVTKESCEQERQLRTDEIDKQACLHKAEIDLAEKRTADENRLIEAISIQIENEARLEALARMRIQAEQTERSALASRVDAERQLADQLALRIEQEKIERAQAAQREALETKLKLATAEREEHERQLQAEELASYARLHEAAIEESHKHAAEALRQTQQYLALLEEESQLEVLARERVKAEQQEQEALVARIEAERRLAAQIEARIEQERIEHAQANRRAVHEENLRISVARREAQESQFRTEELAAQAYLHQTAIEESRKRLEEEKRRAAEFTAQRAAEARLEELAQQRVQIEQVERLELAARIEAERHLLVQVEARLEAEKFERDIVAQRKAEEEKLRLFSAKREQIENRFKLAELPGRVLRYEAANNELAVPGKIKASRHNSFIGSAYWGTGRNRIVYPALAMFILVVGIFLIFGLWGNSKVAMPLVQSANLTVQAGVSEDSHVPPVSASVDHAGLKTSADPRTVAEIRQRVLQWAKAWSSRDAEFYLSFYAPDFRLPSLTKRVDWEAQRKLKLSQYHSIEVDLKNIKISYSGGDAASVSFTQDFRADNYRETGTHKELLLKNFQGRWLILGEKNT